MHVSSKLLSLAILLPLLVRPAHTNGDCNILEKCQQDVIDFFNNSSLPGSSSAYHGQGLSWSSSNCGLIRQKLGCIINLASICQSRDNLTIKSTSTILAEIKRFLQMNCYQNRDWTNSPCFASPEVVSCASSLAVPEATVLDAESCKNYLAFRECVVNFAHTKCNNQDQDNVILYLIEKGSHLSWKCSNISLNKALPENQATFQTIDQYNNHIGKRGSPDYEQQDRFGSLENENPNANHQHQGGILFPSKQFPMDYFYSGQTNAQPMSINLAMSPHPPPPAPFPGPSMPGYYQHPTPPRGQTGPVSLFSMDSRYGNKGSMASYMPDSSQVASSDKMPISRPDISLDSPGSYGSAQPVQSRADKCVQRARYIGRHCEEAISQSFRMARRDIESRDTKAEQCCGVKRFVECFGQILQQICPEVDASSLLEAIPRSRRSEIASCRPYASSQCGEEDFANQTLEITSNLLIILMSLIVNFIK